MKEVTAQLLSPENLQKYKLELLFIAIIAIYGLFYLRGCGIIKKLATGWTK